jgi:type I restriction enzyme R subunit
VSAFDDLSLIDLIVARGADAVNSLPERIRKNEGAVAETIENNVRRLIIDEQPINPKYYEKMSELLDALIAQRKKEALDYQKYLEKIVELTTAVTNPTSGASYPKALNTPAKRALYDNLRNDEALALTVDAAVHASRQDDWRSNPIKIKMVRLAIKDALRRTRQHGSAQAGRVAEAPGSYGLESEESFDDLVDRIVELVKNQNAY